MKKPIEQHGSESRFARFLILLLCVVLMAYTVARAITVSFSWDESWTFMHHVLPGMFYQEAYDKMGGNHHLLNVWLMWGSMKLFGESELALRLPNLAAHLVYLLASAGIALRNRSAFMAIGAFLLMNVHPYLLDFFSLARGYGLACGWMVLSLYQATRFVSDDDSMRRLGLAASFASLSALSHVIMVNYLLAFAAAMGAFVIFDGRKRPKGFVLRRLALLSLIVLAGLAVIMPNALGLFGGGSLNFGCDRFWECTVLSLGGKVIYHLPYETPLNVIVGRALKLSGLFIAVTAVVASRGGWLPRLRPMALGLIILALCLLSFLAQQSWFGVPLPQTRTALFLLPLSAFTWAAAIGAWPAHRWVPALAAASACSVLIVNLANSVNFTYAVEWKPSGELSHMLTLLENDRPALQDDRPIITVGTGFESAEPMNYYRHVRGLQWLTKDLLPSEGEFPYFDYYIVEYEGLDRVDTTRCTLLYHSESTNSALYRDERFRNPARRWISRYEGPAQRLIGASDELAWSVSADVGDSSFMAIGTIDAFESAATNWLSLNLDLIRDNEIIESANQPSHPQIESYGRWNKVSVGLRLKHRLLPGDRLRFIVYTLYAEPAIFIGGRELRILR